MKQHAIMELLHRQVLTDTKTGKLLNKPKWTPSHSFTLQWMKHMEAFICHVYGTSAPTPAATKDTAGANQVIFGAGITTQNNSAVMAIATDATYGIVAGTGTAAIDNTDYRMNPQIAHGVGATQLSYGAGTYTTCAVVGANVDLVLSRPLLDVGGGNITITEIGIYCKSSALIFCIVRDLSTQAIANGQTDTIQYTLRTTV